MRIGAPTLPYKPMPLIILNRAISVTKVGTSIPMKNRATTAFLNLNSNRSMM